MNIYDTMQNLMIKNEKETKEFMVNWLTPYYTQENIINTSDYVLCKGGMDVALVVHLDTVKENNRKNAKLYYNKERLTMFCPGYPGFDDKSGLCILMLLLERNYRPHIILTTGEELGAIGSSKLIQDYPFCPFKDVKYLIQIDRQGKQEFVTYDCDNPEFDKYISSFGWEKREGTFSDISYLAPCWGIAACNVSAAYMNEHTLAETLHVNWLIGAVNRISLMFTEAYKAPKFDYIPCKPNYTWTTSADFVKCETCKGRYSIKDIKRVMIEDVSTQVAMCSDCRKILNVRKCKKCKELYWDFDNQKKCPNCSKEAKEVD